MNKLSLLTCLVAVFSSLNVSVALAAGEDVVLVEKGTHELLRQNLSVKRVAVGDESIANVNVINRHELLVSGKAKGVTSLLIWFKETRQTKALRIVVKDVSNPLAEQQAPDKELATAQISPGQLAGELPDLAAHARAKAAAADGDKGVQDRSSLAIGSQVLTEIKIAELSRSTLKQYGFNWNYLSDSGKVGGIARPGTSSFQGNVGASLGTNPITGNTGVTLSQTGAFSIAAPISNAFSIVFGNLTEGFLGALSMLENQGLVRILARPSLAAMTGQTATFLAGGEFPVPVSQGTTGAITIEYKEFGVRLSLTPTVLAENRIALKVAPEVSELDFSAGVSVGGTAVPALTVRRTDTMVELGDGESFVISGLISRNMMANVDKVPFLGSVPILGSFFKSSRYDREERELVMVVTPHLVKPLKSGAHTPELPGSEYDDYKPGAAKLMFMESGKFGTGYSR